jgi:aspartate/methionine/tyrosine aminotransferase
VLLDRFYLNSPAQIKGLDVLFQGWKSVIIKFGELSLAKYASRLDDISAFKAMKVFARAQQLQESGMNVIHLEVGEPDFPTPAPIVAAARLALDRGQTKYTPAQGIPALRDAIAAHYQSRYGLVVDAERIFVTAGGSGALLLATALILNPGEGMLMTDPGYPCNRHFMNSFDGEGQLVPVGSEQGYQLSAELVDRAWRDNTRGVLLASPANPTGAILDRQELSDIAAVVKSRGGHLIVDEIYHGLNYGNSEVTSALEFDAIVVNSFSKYFGMTGWRLGWLVVPDDAIDNVEKLAQNLFICPSSIAQQAAVAAFSDEARHIMEEQRSAFEVRRNLMVAGLRDLGFGVPETPGGAFYVYAKLPDIIKDDSETFCLNLLESHGVATTPGTDFGYFEADRHVRFSYANDIESLEEALRRIKLALK